MKILFLDNSAFAKLDMIDAFREYGITCDLFFHENIYDRQNDEIEKQIYELCQKNDYLFCFSFNYFPILATCCHQNHLRYVSFVYDSPLVALYSYTVIHPCNYIFIFDKHTYLSLKNAGISTVYYMPLAANIKRLSSMKADERQKQFCSCDVSFVGSLYNEDHNLFDRLVDLPAYTKGYLDSIMNAQLCVQGYFFIEELLTEPILKDMFKAYPYKTQSDGVESASYIYANYFIARKLTAIEREKLLQAVSSKFHLKLFTHNPAETLSNAQFMGTVDYYNMMPFVFRHSKINLNITLRSIHSGIPMRAMDIMGAGGFLLTNYQEDFFDYFNPGEDFIYYEDQEDLLQKISYYLSHDEERNRIARNGFQKVSQHHTYCHRVRAIFDILEQN